METETDRIAEQIRPKLKPCIDRLSNGEFTEYDILPGVLWIGAERGALTMQKLLAVEDSIKIQLQETEKARARSADEIAECVQSGLEAIGKQEALTIQKLLAVENSILTQIRETDNARAQAADENARRTHTGLESTGEQIDNLRTLIESRFAEIGRWQIVAKEAETARQAEMQKSSARGHRLTTISLIFCGFNFALLLYVIFSAGAGK